jgi:hypothetical protein
MKKAEHDEADAFRPLPKLASDRNRRLVEIARMLPTAEDGAREPTTGRGQGIPRPERQRPLASPGIAWQPAFDLANSGRSRFLGDSECPGVEPGKSLLDLEKPDPRSGGPARSPRAWRGRSTG